MVSGAVSGCDAERLAAVEYNVKHIGEKIRRAAVASGRGENDVRFMAVTKTVEPVYINKAIECGIDLIGENKVQEFTAKKDMLDLRGVEKHLIGHLQTNKVRKIIGEVDMIQSVDSLHLAEEIDRRASELGIRAKVLLEVNIGAEESKTGLDKSKVEELAARVAGMPNLELRGLMTIPPFSADESETAAFFDEMYKLFIDIKSKNSDNNIDILSMGMSSDYELAVRCGSTLVRVGSALFGPRTYV